MCPIVSLRVHFGELMRPSMETEKPRIRLAEMMRHDDSLVVDGLINSEIRRTPDVYSVLIFVLAYLQLIRV